MTDQSVHDGAAGEGTSRAPGRVAVDTPAPGVRRLRIINSERRGSLSRTVLSELTAACTNVPSDVRALVVTGSGTVFSAGYDLRGLASPSDPAQADRLIAPEHVEAFTALEAQPLPVVAALNGPAFGGGLELALACDLRIGVPSSALGVPAGRLGLVYSPGAFDRLLRVIPRPVLAEMLITAGMVSAVRAERLGLLNAIVDDEQLDDEAVAMATAAAGLSSTSVQAHRRALRGAQGASLSDEARQELARAREAGMRSADWFEGTAAFVERRAPAELQ